MTPEAHEFKSELNEACQRSILNSAEKEKAKFSPILALLALKEQVQQLGMSFLLP